MWNHLSQGAAACEFAQRQHSEQTVQWGQYRAVSSRHLGHMEPASDDSRRGWSGLRAGERAHGAAGLMPLSRIVSSPSQENSSLSCCCGCSAAKTSLEGLLLVRGRLAMSVYFVSHNISVICFVVTPGGRLEPEGLGITSIPSSSTSQVLTPQPVSFFFEPRRLSALLVTSWTSRPASIGPPGLAMLLNPTSPPRYGDLWILSEELP